MTTTSKHKMINQHFSSKVLEQETKSCFLATARLGDRVVVRTALENKNFELEAIIDLIELKEKTRTDKTTIIPVEEKPKTFKKSGTIIEISKFHPRSKNLLNR